MSERPSTRVGQLECPLDEGDPAGVLPDDALRGPGLGLEPGEPRLRGLVLGAEFLELLGQGVIGDEGLPEQGPEMLRLGSGVGQDQTRAEGKDEGEGPGEQRLPERSADLLGDPRAREHEP